jgi:hypothetical protein
MRLPQRRSFISSLDHLSPGNDADADQYIIRSQRVCLLLPSNGTSCYQIRSAFIHHLCGYKNSTLTGRPGNCVPNRFSSEPIERKQFTIKADAIQHAYLKAICGSITTKNKRSIRLMTHKKKPPRYAGIYKEKKAKAIKKIRDLIEEWSHK